MSILELISAHTYGQRTFTKYTWTITGLSGYLDALYVMLIAIWGEFLEFLESTWILVIGPSWVHAWDAIEEASDTWYSVVKFALTAICGRNICYWTWPWWVLYVAAPITARKFAERIRRKGCPRSDRNCAKSRAVIEEGLQNGISEEEMIRSGKAHRCVGLVNTKGNQ